MVKSAVSTDVDLFCNIVCCSWYACFCNKYQLYDCRGHLSLCVVVLANVLVRQSWGVLAPVPTTAIIWLCLASQRWRGGPVYKAHISTPGALPQSSVCGFTSNPYLPLTSPPPSHPCHLENEKNVPH